MQRLLLLALFSFQVTTIIAQEKSEKFLIGVSIGYAHDDKTNNNLLNNILPNEVYFSNSFQFRSEFGYFFSSGSLIGIDIGIVTERSERKREASQFFNTIEAFSYTNGIALNPKYRLTKRISENLWLYTDLKIVLEFVKHHHHSSQLNIETYEFEETVMSGNEFKYGLAIEPGAIFKLTDHFGIKMEYSFLNILHSKIKEADDSNVKFESIDAWDYSMNRSLSGFNLGVVFTW